MSLEIENLIKKGYFARELVPAFNTNNLSTNLGEIIIDLNSYTKRNSSFCTYSIPKLKDVRRYLGIPNPLHQIRLSKSIADNWGELSNFFTGSNISLTTPTIYTNKERAVSPKSDFVDVNIQRVLKSTSSRYLIKADISRYYNTIYTHSIPWAYHGKLFAKNNRGLQYLGNLIDKDVRNTQSEQTFGIPVGPDTSLVISEVIGTKIDLILQETFTNLNGIRYIDDFYLYFSNLYEAEKCLSLINSILRDYELEINPTKTKIIELPESIDLPWVSDLRLHGFKDKSSSDIISYFSKVFEYSKSFPDDHVIKYALSRIKSHVFNESSWELLESFVLKCAMTEPAVLPVVLEILLSYEMLGYNLNTNRIEETINQLIIYHSDFNHNFEVSWSLWVAKSLSLNINPEASNKLSSVENPIVALIALDLLNSGLISALDLSLWKAFMKAEELYTQNWILAYEAYNKGWLPSKSGRNYIASDDFFGLLQRKNISFYDPNLQINCLNPITQHINQNGNIEEANDYYDNELEENEDIYRSVAASRDFLY